MAFTIFAVRHKKNNKLIFGVFLLFISMINPGCTHQHPNGKQLYMNYLKSRIINTKKL